MFPLISKRNLATITCSLAQNDLVDFVEEYGISWCYDPKLLESGQTALDAPNGYIPLYMSLFSIGNLCFPLNNFCLDVFEFFRCHFLLLNPFGVACVTTFVVSCKAYGEEATVPLFRAFLTLGASGDWLTFQNRHGSKIPALFGNSLSNILDWKSKFIFVKETLIFDIRLGLITDFYHGQGTFAFPYPTEPFDKDFSWEHALSNLSIFVDESLEEEATMVKVASKKKKLDAPRRISARGSVPPLPATSPKGAGKHPRVLARFNENLASSSDSLAPDVEKAHAAYSMISSHHYPLLRDKLGFLNFNELVDGHAKLKNDVVSLKSKKGLLEHEMSKLEDRLAKAQKNQDVEDSQFVKDLRFENA
ncbi:hypothetical protein Tco_1043844 [Tanacetum coccineum]|uniref:Transposase (putative) gypsy type domain-containing protein n=1 Tax=Tanacetum coccineum TaxID=301880 RepID=A0ABQ5GPG9_9ASTR